MSAAMYPSGRRSSATRLPPNNFQNLKTVEVGRGRNGYGFTVAGQHPCVLSCIMPSSPAEFAMLKPGDCVIAVNGENVTKLNHEQFIKLIGETTGVLRLTVADMAMEDLSDDDDYYYEANQMTGGGGAYPRARSLTPGLQRTQMVLEELNNGALFEGHPSRMAHYTQQMYYGRNVNGFTPRMDSQDKFAPGHLSPFNNRTDPAVNTRNKSRVYEPDNYWRGRSLDRLAHGNKPERRQRDHRQRVRPMAQRSYYVQEDPYADEEEEEGDDEADTDTRPLTPYELNNITYPSMLRTNLKQTVTADHFEEGDSSPTVRVVVGYLGSVDIPAAANLPTASLQAIRGCVRRLRIEQRIHSLMLMNIDPSGIRLLNARSQVTVTYPADKIVFSGVCPDDKHCFGVVTVQNEDAGQTSQHDDEEAIGSACHVFIIDPELSSHQMHQDISLQFGLNCVPSLETHTCAEYPSSSRLVLHHISHFYQDKQDNSHFADFYGQAPYAGVSRRSNSGSSNGDSGFGNGGRDGVQTNGSDQILDVASHIRNQRANRTLTTSQNQGRPRVPSYHNSHNVNLAPSEFISHPSSEMSPSTNNICRGNLEDKLTPRARPDPVQILPRPSHAVTPTVRAESVSIFDMAQSTVLPVTQRDNRRLLQRQLSHEPCWENGRDIRPGSLPKECNIGMEMFMNSGHHTYLNQPAIPIRSQYQQSYLQHHGQGMANLRRGSDCSDYSSAQKAAKRNALKRAQGKMPTLQDQNRNSLTASDGELTSIDDCVLKQDGNTASQADLAEETPPAIGRVSGWAVSFERLLKDELGLRYFTDFLKQEFSEENILFWIACEKLNMVTEKSELQQNADSIYSKFLSPQATMPVNLEGDYRQMVEQAIKNPSPEMYKEQQLQIFKLMKLDSYSRFLKSKLYQDCVLSEMGNLPMPTIETQSITELGGSDNGQVMPPSPDMDKDKNQKKKDTKLGKNKPQSREVMERPESPQRQLSEEKKRSLLPWFRGFTNKRPGSQRNGKETQFYITSPEPITSTHDLHVSQSDTQLIGGAHTAPSPLKEMVQRSNTHFMVLFPNNITVVINIVPDKCIGEVLLPLCEEHGLSQQTAEIFIKATKELVDLHQDVSVLAGKDLTIERRIVFKIELPSKRLIGVKSKPTKKLIEVLRPVTYKYNLQLDALVIHLSNSPIPLDLEITVAALDNQRILIETLEQYRADDIKSKCKETDQVSVSSDDSAQQSEQSVKQDPSKKMALEKPPASSKIDSSKESAALTMQQNNNNHRGLRATSGSDDLYRLVAKANRRRLDDQRGLTIRNLQLPDFLIPKEPADRPASTLGFTDLERNQRNETVNGRLTEMEGKRPMSTPPTLIVPPTASGFTTGKIPSHEEADSIFGGLHGMSNISFSDSLVSSGSIGDGAIPKEYSIPEDGPNYNRKVSGISMSELSVPMSPGFDVDVTLTSLNTGEEMLPPTLTPGPDVTLQVGLPEYPPPTPLVNDNSGQQMQNTLPEENSLFYRNNNHLKTLYEESSTYTKDPTEILKPKPKVARKPVVARKPPVVRTTSLPAHVKSLPPMMTVVGTDGRMHRATFV